MNKIIVKRLYNENDEMVVISENLLEKGYYFGESQSFLIDKKINIDEFIEYINKNGKANDFFDEKGINYYSLYTDNHDCRYNGVNPYKTIEEIEELEKEYPYYVNLDGSIELYDNKDILVQNEEFIYFRYHNNSSLKTVEIEEEFEELQLIEYSIRKEDTYQIDLYKNKDEQYVTVYSNYYQGSLDYVEDYNITSKELKAKYNVII